MQTDFNSVLNSFLEGIIGTIDPSIEKKRFCPSERILASFKDVNTHRTVWENGHNMGFNTNLYWAGHNHNLRSLVTDLIKDQGDNFFLNEMPDRSDHMIYIDIDMKISVDSIISINSFLEEIVITDFAPLVIKVLQNEESGKIHMIINIKINSSPRCLRKEAILLYLRDYLYDAVSTEVSLAEWIAAFDATAPGIRSAYSIKFRDNQIVSRARYLPLVIEGLWTQSVIDRSVADLIVEYSMYNDETVHTAFKPSVWEQIDKYEMDIMGLAEMKKMAKDERNKKLIDHSAYNTSNNSIEINGSATEVNQELIDTIISTVPVIWGQGKRWLVMLQHVRSAAVLVKGFDPEYFLHKWSLNACPAEYNRIQNNSKYYRAVDVAPEMAGASLTWLRDRGAEPADNIFNKNIKLFYDHYTGLMNKDYDKSAIRSFIKSTIAYVIQGGRSLWITKTQYNREISYTIIKCNSSEEKNFKSIQWMIEKNNKIVPHTLYDEMMSIRNHITYSRVDFIPVADLKLWANPENVFNMFVGLQAEKVSNPNYDSITIILDHIRVVLSNNNSEIYEYLLNWLAQLVQHPEIKPNIALLFKSEQGAGKNAFWEFVMTMIIGRRNAGITNDIEMLVGRFNVFLENKILTICDEIQNYGGMFKSNDKLKSLITQTENIIERKGMDVFKTLDYNRYVFLTNNDWPVRIERGDRRYLAIECCNVHVGKCDYFKRLFCAFTQENGNIFYTFLMARDLTGWSATKICDTGLKRELMMNSLQPPIHFLIYIIENNDMRFLSDNDLPLKCSTRALYTAFNEWQEGNRAKDRITERNFSSVLSKVLGQSARSMRIDDCIVRGYEFNTRGLKISIEDYVGYHIFEEN